MPASQPPTQAEQTKKSAPEHKSQSKVTAPELAVASLELQTALGNPLSARPEAILRLQRMAGNRAVTKLIQRKVVVGPAHDHYEQEADRVAQQVMSAPVTAPVQRAPEDEEEIQTKPLAASITPLVQRAPEEEEEIQTKPLLQRQEDEEEVQPKSLLQRQAEDEEEIQTKPAASGESFAPGAGFEQRLSAQKSGGQPLPSDTRAFMESRFGADFSGVRIHADGAAIQLNRDVQAQAFTHGNDIFMGEGKYNPQSEAGKQLLAHELTHTIQQGASSVQRSPAASPMPTIQAAALVNSGVVQLKEVFIHSKAHTRIAVVDPSKPAATQMKQVEKGAMSRELKKLDTLEVDDDGSATHVLNEKGEPAWLRVKGTAKEYVRAEKTYDLGYKPTKQGVEGLAQVKDKMDQVKDKAEGPESEGEEVVDTIGEGLGSTTEGIDDSITNETEENGMITPEVENHEAAGASGVIGAVGGLIGLAMGLKSLAAKGGSWDEKLEAIIDTLSGATDTAGGITKAVSEFQGGGDDLAATKASGWIDSVGSVFASIKSGFATIRNLVQVIQMAMDEEKRATSQYFEQIGRIIKSALDTASSVANSVKTFWEAVEGAAPAVFGQLIPGLDIAISGVQIIMKGYYLITSAYQWRQMQKVSEKMDADLHGANPTKEDKKNVSDVRDFYKGKEASIANNKAYVAEKQAQIDKLQVEHDAPTTSAKKKAQLAIILARKKGKRDSALRQITQAENEIRAKETDATSNPKGITQEALAESDLVDELKDANKKRIVRQSIHILAEAAKIAGSITTLSGVAAPAGVALKASAAGLDLSLPLFRAIKQYGRGLAARNLAKGESGLANKIFNPAKATAAKLESRKRHAVRVLTLAANLPVPTVAPSDPGYNGQKTAFDKKGTQVEGYIAATGCPPEKLYAINGHPLEQVKLLATEMAKREFAE